METIKTLNKLGMALSAERDQQRLLQLILTSARQICRADAGTLYVVDYDVTPPKLRFAQVQNDTLAMSDSVTNAPGQLGFTAIALPSLGSNDPQTHAAPNDTTQAAGLVVQHAIENDCLINIADVYQVTTFDVSGTKAFDAKSGYRSQSMLVVPMRDHDNQMIGALQLINKQHDGVVIAFNQDDEEMAQSLASQGAVALAKQRLIDSMQTLFVNFTQVIASAIDSKSPQTGAHCRRVPDVTLMFAKAGCRSELPVVRDFKMSEEELHELELAAWLHDCGKIVTPHHVMEKSTKLETVRDGIELIEARLEILQRDAQIAKLQAALNDQQQVADNEPVTPPQPSLDYAHTADFLAKLNQGAEQVTEQALAQLAELADVHYTTYDGRQQPLLDPAMLENLAIRRGTLNQSERQIMNDHMKHTLSMLEQLSFPKHLARVPEYAGGHHERMDGKGYPRGLTREQMSIPARMMGIADVFEALTAPERTYKQPMSLSQALTIMGRMVEDGHLDGELFQVFIDEQVYLDYAHLHLREGQIDEIDLTVLPGYQG